MEFQYILRLRTKFFCNIVLQYWVFLHELVVFTGPVTLEDKAIKLFQNAGQQTHSGSPGRAADHSSPSSATVMEEYSYTSTHPLGHIGPVTGSLYLYLLHKWFTDGDKQQI